MRIGPQPGAQSKFAACPADICIFGGSAFGGKSHALLLEAAKWVNLPRYEAVIFRREQTTADSAGGIFNEAKELYSQIGGRARSGKHSDVVWPNGSVIQFGHLNNEGKIEVYMQGRQLAFAGFDELTHFTEKQFWYVWSRMRTKCGLNAYMRATCNPDPDSWVAKLIAWWIDQDTGYAIPERDGVLRWFCRVGDELEWYDSKEECQQRLDDLGDVDAKPTSLTFIRSRMEDNQIGMRDQPDYKARIAAQDAVTRAQLLDGNWKKRMQPGIMFDRDWFRQIDILPDPSQWASVVRGWDKAASRPSEDYPDPDWTRGVKWIRLKNGQVIVADVVSLRDAPPAVDKLMIDTARLDGPECVQAFWRDPGQAGIVDMEHTNALFGRKLPNVRVKWEKEVKNKEEYAKPLSAYLGSPTKPALILRRPWTADFLAELHNFPHKKHKKDQVDASSRAWIELDKDRVAGDALRWVERVNQARA